MSNTPDDPMQDLTVLASAYLDGEVTPDERAQVESSPELLAEVDQLRQVRALVAADDEPAAVSVRETHLAAALDVFDQLGMGATGAAASSPTPISAGRVRRRRRSAGQSGERARLALSVAAGLVVLAGVGAVIRGVVTTSNDDSDADSSEGVADEPAEESLDGPSEADVLAEVQGENTNDDLPLDIDESEVASDALEREQAAEEPADEPAEAPADDEAMEEEAAEAEPAEDFATEESADDGGGFDDADATTAAGDAPPEVDVVEIVTPQDLADLAAPAAYAPEPPSDGDAEVDFADLPCVDERPDGLGIDRFAEPAFLVGQLVNVGVDLDRERAFAFLDDCTVVLDALLPSEDEFLATNPTVPPTTAAP